VVLFCVKLNAQNKNLKPFINQLEFGFNYMHYYNNNPNTSGWGQIKEGNSYYINSTCILSYQLIYKEKHSFKIGLSNFYSSIDYTYKVNNRKSSFINNNILIGYNYNIYFKNFIIKPGILFNYRRLGAEAAVGDYRSNGSGEASLISLEYEAPLGGGIGLDLNYFITKNIGFSLSTYVNYFPFENAKFYADNSISSAFKQWASEQKPNNFYVITSLSLAYKFALPKFGKE
jgi:hypothetical protein